MGYLHDICDLPFHSHPRQKLTPLQCFNILLDPELSQEKICSRVPFSVSCNALFVVNLGKLQKLHDILVDDMGVWRWKGSYRVWSNVNDGELTLVGKKKPTGPGPAYQMWKRYYENGTSTDVKKYVVLLEGRLVNSTLYTVYCILKCIL